jgi:hypothetical protein
MDLLLLMLWWWWSWFQCWTVTVPSWRGLSCHHHWHQNRRGNLPPEDVVMVFVAVAVAVFVSVLAVRL